MKQFLVIAVLLGALAPAAAELVRISPEQRTALGIETAPLAASGDLHSARFPAEVAVPNAQLQVVTAPQAGVVEMLLVAEGEEIHQGQPLVRIQSPRLLELQGLHRPLDVGQAVDGNDLVRVVDDRVAGAQCRSQPPVATSQMNDKAPPDTSGFQDLRSSGRRRVVLTPGQQLRDRRGQSWVPVTEHGDGMPAVQVEYPAPARVFDKDAGTADRIDRQQRIDFVQMRAHHAHPDAAAVRPVAWGRSSSRLTHCSAPPAAPLSRLSSTEQTTTVSPSTRALKAA